MGHKHFLVVTTLIFTSLTTHATAELPLPTPPWDEIHELIITSADAKLLSGMKIDIRGLHIADLPETNCELTLSLFPENNPSAAEVKYSQELVKLLTANNVSADLLEMVRVQLGWIANVPDAPDTSTLNRTLTDVIKTLPQCNGLDEIQKALKDSLQKARNYIQQIKNKVAKGKNDIFLIQDRISFVKNLITAIEAERDTLPASETSRAQYINAVILASLREDVVSLENKKTRYEIMVESHSLLQSNAERGLANIESNF